MEMTALLDDVDKKVSDAPAIGGSFDGSHLVLRFTYWMPRSNGDLEPRVASYEATVNPSGSEMTGVWTQEGSWPLHIKRVTWQAKIPKPAPPTIFDGDWAGIEYKSRGLTIHFILHIHNTEDGLMVTIDCPDEKFKGALASKVSYDQSFRSAESRLDQVRYCLVALRMNAPYPRKAQTENGSVHIWIAPATAAQRVLWTFLALVSSLPVLVDTLGSAAWNGVNFAVCLYLIASAGGTIGLLAGFCSAFSHRGVLKWITCAAQHQDQNRSQNPGKTDTENLSHRCRSIAV